MSNEKLIDANIASGEWPDAAIDAALRINGITSFVKACKKRYVHIAAWMIDHGANIHIFKDVALRRAALYGHSEMVKMLLDKGADGHIIDKLNLGWGHEEIVKIIENWKKKNE